MKKFVKIAAIVVAVVLVIALVAPMVLAGGWMALGLFVMVLGLVGTGLLALARMKAA